MDDEKRNRDVEEFFKFLTKMFEKSLYQGGDSNSKSFGFSISVGPDGTPSVKPFNQQRNGYETPLTDKIEHKDMYEIVMDVPGITKEEQIKLVVNTDSIEFKAENNEFRYKQLIKFEYPINKKIKAHLKNRTIVIQVLKKT